MKDPAYRQRTIPTTSGGALTRQSSSRVIMFLSIIAILLAALVAWRVASDRSREEEVAQRGAIVMPFDLERTTHIFRPDDRGGVQTVVVDDRQDREQVTLVRNHLKAEAQLFAEGDFSDPARIHGDDMPGLRVLQSQFDEIDVAYVAQPEGARITFRADDANLVSALHAWFAAQVDDHGGHASH